ncbi:MAG: flagellar hook-length control protein FliK [Candidatus Kapaibacterium sp.]
MRTTVVDASTNAGGTFPLAMTAPDTRGGVRVASDAGLSAGARVFRVTMDRFVPQTSAILSNMMEQAESTAKLILTPESLGTIVVTMTMQEHQSMVRMEVVDAGARDLVQANLGQLREQCAAQGVRLDHVAVTVREPESSQWRFDNGSQQSRQQRRDDAEARSAFLRSGQREEAGRRSGDDARGSSRDRGHGHRRRSPDDAKFERYA